MMPTDSSTSPAYNSTTLLIYTSENVISDFCSSILTVLKNNKLQNITGNDSYIIPNPIYGRNINDNETISFFSLMYTVFIVTIPGNNQAGLIFNDKISVYTLTWSSHLNLTLKDNREKSNLTIWLENVCIAIAGQEDAGRPYTYYVQLIGEIMIACVAIMSNGAVLLSIVTYPSLQTVTNYFVASLSTADLFVGLIGIPCVLAAMHQMPHNFSGCLTVNTMIVILTQISIFSLLVIAVERFYAIRYPFDYGRVCTPKLAAFLIGLTWVLSVLVTLLPSFAWNLDKMPKYKRECNFMDVIDLRYMVFFNFFGCVLTPLILMTGIYCYIFSVVLKQIRSIDASQLRPSGNKETAKQKRRPTSPAKVEDKISFQAEKKVGDMTYYDIDAFKRMEEEKYGKIMALGVNSRDENSIVLDSAKLLKDGSEDKISEETKNFENEAKGTHSLDDDNNPPKPNINLELEETANQNNAAIAKRLGYHLDEKIEKKVLFNECRDDDDKNKNIKKNRKESKPAETLKNSAGSSRWAKDIKAAKWFAVVLMCFIICWIPLHILNCMIVINGIVSAEALTFAILLSHLNSAFNPILYAFGNSKFSAAFRKLAGCKSNKVDLNEASTTH